VAVFQWFFVSVAGCALVLSALLARLPEEKGQSVEPILIGNATLCPMRAATHLVNLIDRRSLGRNNAPAPEGVNLGAWNHDYAGLMQLEPGYLGGGETEK
jgi:hypothetical protein